MTNVNNRDFNGMIFNLHPVFDSITLVSLWENWSYMHANEIQRNYERSYFGK